MSDEHKAALELGRGEGRAVRAYLEALRANKPKRGRKRTSESMEKRLAAIDELLTDASPVDELLLVQERRDLEAERDALDSDTDMTALEDEFIAVAAAYGSRRDRPRLVARGWSARCSLETGGREPKPVAATSRAFNVHRTIPASRRPTSRGSESSHSRIDT